MGIAEHNRAIELPGRARAWGAWLGTALLLLLFAWRTILPAAQQKTYAFSVYYTAARLTLDGQAGVRFCSPWFFDQQRALGFGDRADFFCPNPPANALVLLPVAWLPPGPAQAAWIGCDLLMLGAIAAIGWRIVRRTGRGGAAAPSAAWFALSVGLIAVLYQPLRAELRAVQVYVVLALLYALWLYGYLTRRDWLCGVALAGLTLIKLSGWPLWLLMLAVRRWRALVWAVGVGVAVGLAALPLLPFEFWRVYLFEQVPAISADGVNGVPAYQTLASLLRQLFVYDARWSPRPLLDAPWLANVIWWLLAGALLACTLIPAYRRSDHEANDKSEETGDRRPETSVPARSSPVARLVSRSAGLTDPSATSLVVDPLAMAGLCLVVPLQPAGEEHHYALLLIVWLIFLSQPGLALLRSPIAIAGLVLAGVLFVLPSYFLQTAQWQGWPIAVLAYPRMYGALIVWGILLGLEYRRLKIEDR